MQIVMGVVFCNLVELRMPTADWARSMVAGTGFRDAAKAALASVGLDLMDFDGAMAIPNPDETTSLRLWSKRWRQDQRRG